jgi:hypothetical protein
MRVNMYQPNPAKYWYEQPLTLTLRVPARFANYFDNARPGGTSSKEEKDFGKALKLCVNITRQDVAGFVAAYIKWAKLDPACKDLFVRWIGNWCGGEEAINRKRAYGQ